MKKKLSLLISLLLVSMFAFSASAASASASTWGSFSERVYYDRKESSSYSFLMPEYDGTNNPALGGCGPVGGANVLAYYDRTFPGLVPEFSEIVSVNGFKYFISTLESYQIIADLHGRMNTDADGGTTAFNFKSGLRQYGLANGHSITYVDVGYGGEFWYDYYKEEILKGNPVLLCFSKFNLGSFGYVSDSYVAIDLNTSEVPHIMIGRGYAEVKYYKMVGGREINFRNDIFLRVTPGLYNKGYYVLLNSTIQIDYATAVKVSQIG